jgi:hypothetical protein
MRAKTKPTKGYFCGEARGYSPGIAYIKLVHANSATEALFEYIKERDGDLDAGDEIVVIEAGASQPFILMDDEPKETAEEIVEKYATDTEATPETVEAEAANG